MGWIQQTKQASRKSGGPQYYLQGLEGTFKAFLKDRGVCEVWLGTPYGVIQSGLKAVAADKVLTRGKIRPGNVGHERIQGRPSAGLQILHWFNLEGKGEPLKDRIFGANIPFRTHSHSPQRSIPQWTAPTPAG